MYDQAERLRQIVNQHKIERREESVSVKVHTGRVIAITSGKGGVGKTNFTVNLAIVLAKLGKRVVVIDADLGLANIDVLLGSRPLLNLSDFINGEASLSEIMMDGPDGIKIIPGGSGITELANLGQDEINSFVAKLLAVEQEVDYILIDTGAGLAKDVMSFVLAADEVIVLSTGEPTSITDAYATIKFVSLAKKMQVIKLVVNAVENHADAEQVSRKLMVAAKRFLGVDLEYIGFLIEDEAVSKAVKGQRPFILSYPKAKVSLCLKNVARSLCEQESRSLGR